MSDYVYRRVVGLRASGWPLHLRPVGHPLGLKRRNVSYNQLVEKLAAIGVQESEPKIRNKLARGKFTAVFLSQCLEAIEVDSLKI